MTSLRRQWSRWRLLALGTAIAVAVACLSLLTVLAREATLKVEQLATANSDSVQWSTSQADVELLALLIEIRLAQDGDGDLAQVRRRYDVFYGRVRLLQEGPFYQRLRQQQAFANRLNTAADFLTFGSPLIDAPDQVLQDSLPLLWQQAAALRPVLRDLTMVAQQSMAEAADLRRETAHNTLTLTLQVMLLLLLVLVGMIFALARLVREARRQTAAQAQTRARLEAIIAISQDAILVLDHERRIRDFNGAAETLFGQDRLTVMGHKVDGLILGVGNSLPVPWIETTPGAGPHRVTGRRQDGSEFPAEVSVGSAESTDGQVHVLFLRDISDRLAAEMVIVDARDRALAGEKAKADMLAVMSHEMRTPLNGILGTLDLIADTRLSARQAQYLRIIRSSGELLLEHVNDVLDISRLDAGKMPVARRVFDADLLLRDLAESQRPTAEALGNRLDLALGSPSPGWVIGDAMKLRQVLLNLVGNAIKFTRDGSISISARRLTPDLVDITVRDTGIGIPAGDLGRIFDDFFTIDSSYGRTAEGSGLGLPIARRMVQAMGGTTTVESTEGQGSLFRIILPLTATRQIDATAPAAARPTAAARSLKVLVVEDNSTNRFVVSTMLRGDGHRVDAAENGAQGLRMAAIRPYDLILMDVAMPELDGVAATRAIRTSAGASRNAPIVALTAHALPADRIRFVTAGITAILIKPLSRDRLRQLLADLAPVEEPAAETPGTIHALIDPAQISAMIDSLGPEAFEHLYARFVRETTDGIEQITGAAAGTDPQHLAETAHRLAGGAALFGAQQLRQILMALEEALRTGTPDCARTWSKQLHPVWQATCKARLAIPTTTAPEPSLP